MSYIAAGIARDRTSEFLGRGPDIGRIAGQGMAANASDYIADTKYGAMMDYNEEVGQATVSGLKKAGAAGAAAQTQGMIGQGLSSFASPVAGIFGKMFSA